MPFEHCIKIKPYNTGYSNIVDEILKTPESKLEK